MKTLSKGFLVCAAVLIMIGPALALNEPAGSRVEVTLKGLVCDFCAQTLKKAFAKRPEVAASEVNLTTKIMTLDFKAGQTLDDEAIKEIVRKAGYSAEVIKR